MTRHLTTPGEEHMINTPKHRIALSALCLTAMIGSIAVTGPAAGATPSESPSPSESATPSGASTPTGSAAPTGSASAAPSASASASSSPSKDATPSTSAATGSAQASSSPATCTPDSDVTVFSFNDFHGRIGEAAKLFTPVQQARTDKGADHVLLTSAGDNIGGSTFESGSQDDNPTIDILKDAGLEASAVGNHEFDKGLTDLTEHVNKRIDGDFPYLGANVYKKGTTTVTDDLRASTVFTKGGVRIGVIGAVTKDLPSLVSPAGLADLTIGDPVEAVNAEARRLKSEHLADVVVASIHEGAASGGDFDPAKVNGNFTPIYNDLSTDVDVAFNGHTHQLYSWKDRNGAPLLQAASYGTHLAQVDLAYDTRSAQLCSTDAKTVAAPKQANLADPVIARINSDTEAARKQADVIGAKVIGTATAPITTASDAQDSSFGSSVRNRESAMSNMVAQMFKDTLGKDDPNFIGIQNPGGTRASLQSGEITYKDAALVLPFANSLMTTTVTGEQFKQVLEEQWQHDEKGQVPSRPFLSLGLSNNVSYTYDENLPEGQRITSVWVNGKPIDPKASYTVGSGSFLINGGDNFHTLAKGSKPVDTGKIDLDTWVGWIKDQGKLTPSFARRGVSVSAKRVSDTAFSFTFGQTAEKGIAPDTLDLTSKGAPTNTKLVARTSQDANAKALATFDVKDGVATGTIDFSKTSLKSGTHVVYFTAEESGTVIPVEVTITRDDASTPEPSAAPTTPSGSASPSVDVTPGADETPDATGATATPSDSATPSTTPSAAASASAAVGVESGAGATGTIPGSDVTSAGATPALPRTGN